jgi:hypothetical protein
MSLPRVIITVGKLIGEALLAGVGLEIAKVTGEHLKKRLGPKDAKTKEEVAAENDRLKAENAKLKEELSRARQEGELGHS